MRISAAIFTLACALSCASGASINYPSFFRPEPATIVECGPASDLLKIEYVNLNPNPPEKGKVLTIDAKGILSGAIVEGATIDLVVKLGLVKLLTKQLDFCEESAKVDKNCPLAPGEHFLNHSVDLPKEIPPGKYVVNIRVRNPKTADGQLGEEVTCLIAKAQFGV
ncbi:Phosphatidylglycerol/phosphatidylinositol transfer protein [Mortierella sp. AD011]|nr:Phosphatidylglycerol/phosphatidylinositol transfer protein [Mortierella sp. AD010]KAF9398749.1 Phosphatidylglycerol/phosphatidylinositol transfer protein [Mortierella sp. AD011]